MENGQKVKINDKTFAGCLSHLNGQVGTINGHGQKTPEMLGIDLAAGGRCFVNPSNLTPV